MVSISLFTWNSHAYAEDCSSEPKSCSIVELCKIATLTKRGYLDWNFDALKHVMVAKEYGLSCGVEDVADQTNEPTQPAKAKFNKNDFVKYSQLQRHQIQYALKQLGYYQSTVDGLWGSGTSSAINQFILVEGIQTDIINNLYLTLTQKIDVGSVSIQKSAKAVQLEPKQGPRDNNSSKKGAQKVCKLEYSQSFELMFQEEFVTKTVEQFDSLREFKVVGDKLIFGDKVVTSNREGKYKRFVDVLCIDNLNNWSRCGSFRAHLDIALPNSKKITGKLLTPWEWGSNGLPPVHYLNYTCSGF